MRRYAPASRLTVMLVLLVVAAPLTLAQTTIGVFTGGDLGEGLDLDGDFVYAVNARGPAAGLVRDANFTDDLAAGVTLTAVNQILNWTAPDFGATANDDNLEVVMQSIRWSNFPNTVSVDLANLQPGARYRLQLLFGEQCCARGFDVFVEGAQIVDDFAPFVTQGGMNTTAQNNGAVVTHSFYAGDDTLNIVLGGTDTAFGDDNPILQGFTLELLPVPVPAVSPWMLMLMAGILAGFGYFAVRNG